MRVDLRSAGTVAIVGNGPIRADVAAKIDECDVVIRMNHAPLCGVAGMRTDILVLNRLSLWREYSWRPGNPKAFRKASELWVRLEQPATPRVDRRVKLIAAKRPVRELAESDDLKKMICAAGNDWNAVMPSLGAVVFDIVLRESDAIISLFGFKHEGWGGHSWDQEKSWFDAAGLRRLQRFHGEGEPLKRPHSYVVYKKYCKSWNRILGFRSTLI